jgi:hypothetical protein
MGFHRVGLQGTWWERGGLERGARFRELGIGSDTKGVRMQGNMLQAVSFEGHTHSSAREASLSWEAPQTSWTILPRSPRRTRVTLKGKEVMSHTHASK